MWKAMCGVLVLASCSTESSLETTSRTGEELTADQCASSADDAKVTICHATGSSKKPFQSITTSVAACAGHVQHEGDFISIDGSCDAPPPPPLAEQCSVSFLPASTYDVGPTPWATAVGDIDSDGDLDVPAGVPNRRRVPRGCPVRRPTWTTWPAR